MTRHRAATSWRTPAAVVASALLLAGVVSVASAAPAPNTNTGRATCTTNSTGYCTVTHDLGAAPAHVSVTLEAPNAGASKMAYQNSVDARTATTFRVRFFAHNGTSYGSLPVTFTWAAFGTAPAAPTTPPPTTPPATTPAPTTPAPTTTVPPPTTPAPTTPPPAAWPGPTNTGVPAGTTLTSYTGPCTITTAVTIDAKDATNCQALIIKAANVVITRSNLPRIEQTEWSQPWSVNVSDSRVSSPTWSEGVLWGFNITATRVNVTGGQHSVHCNENCTIIDSWLHDQYNPTGGSYHNNAFITNGGTDMVVRGNTLHCTAILNPTDGGCTADVSLFGDFEQVSRVTIDGNLLKANNSSISYCAYGGYQPSKPHPVSTYIKFTNNVFERGPNNKCGVYGPVTSFQATATGNEWTNNKWDDGTVLNP